jgi:hypothetical protein
MSDEKEEVPSPPPQDAIDWLVDYFDPFASFTLVICSPRWEE